MLEIRRFRDEPEATRAGLLARGESSDSVDQVVALDDQLRALSGERDDIRAQINSISREVGNMFKEGKRDEAAVLQEQSRVLGQQEKELDERSGSIEAELRDLLLHLPNLPADECPLGETEADNVILRHEGYSEDRYADNPRVPHWETGESLGILDVERGVKMAGSMFVMYRGAGATLVRALCQLALDRNADLYEEVRPPTLVKTETMVSTGHLPKFIDDAYQLERDDLWAIPTAEVPLTSLARDEILSEDSLPARMMAHTSCFRREAGSAGKDTRGLLRVHEFDKVELLAYATAEQSAEIHDEILKRSESMLVDLGLGYRVLDLCTGDLGNSSRRTFDLEVYAPGVDNWLEVASVSWFGTYQANRANIRFKPAGGKGTEICHTLNGSALAVPRVWAGIVETHLQADGSVELPEVLWPYMRGMRSIGPAAS